MKRRRWVWSGAAVLLLYAAWWFSLAVFHSMRTALITPFLLPALLGVCAAGLLWAGWRQSSIFFITAACLLFAANAILFWKDNRATAGVWVLGWVLLPAFVAVFEWIKNSLGKGWRFSKHQAEQVIFISVTIFSLMFLLMYGGIFEGLPQPLVGWVSGNAVAKISLAELNRFMPGILQSVLIWR